MHFFNVKPVGSLPRYAIVDRKHRNFTGEGWSEDQSDSLLYHSEEEADTDCELFNALYNPHVFTVEARVWVHSPHELEPELLTEYIRNNIQVEIAAEDGHPYSHAEFQIEFDVDEVSKFDEGSDKK